MLRPEFGNYPPTVEVHRDEREHLRQMARMINRITQGKFNCIIPGASGGGTAPPPAANATLFDGEEAYVIGTEAGTANPLGLTNSHFGSLSVWLKIPAASAGTQSSLYAGHPLAIVQFFLLKDAGLWYLQPQLGSADSTGLFIFRNATPIPTDIWVNVLASWDTRTNAATMAVAGVTVVPVTTSSMGTPFLIGYDTDSEVTLFNAHASEGGVSLVPFAYDGAAYDFWLDFTTALDFTQSANVAKFIDGAGNPVALGDHGEIPLGVRPSLFLHSFESPFYTDLGASAGFTFLGSNYLSTAPPP